MHFRNLPCWCNTVKKQKTTWCDNRVKHEMSALLGNCSKLSNWKTTDELQWVERRQPAMLSTWRLSTSATGRRLQQSKHTTSIIAFNFCLTSLLLQSHSSWCWISEKTAGSKLSYNPRLFECSTNRLKEKQHTISNCIINCCSSNRYTSTADLLSHICLHFRVYIFFTFNFY